MRSIAVEASGFSSRVGAFRTQPTDAGVCLLACVAIYQVRGGSTAESLVAVSLDVLCLCSASLSITDLRHAIIDTLVTHLSAAVALAAAHQCKHVAAHHFQPDGLSFPVTVR